MTDFPATPDGVNQQRITGLLPSPTIEALRAALDYLDITNTGRVGDYAGLGQLIDAARAVIAEWDSHVATVKAMLDMPRPTPEEIRRIYVSDTATEVFGTSK